jgi:hypothetical protein
MLQVARSCTLDKSSGLFLDTEQVISNCCKTAQQDRLSIGVVLRTRPHKTDSAQTGRAVASTAIGRGADLLFAGLERLGRDPKQTPRFDIKSCNGNRQA